MKKLITMALLVAMLLSCFAGCAMQKGEIAIDGVAVENVGDESEWTPKKELDADASVLDLPEELDSYQFSKGDDNADYVTYAEEASSWYDKTGATKEYTLTTAKQVWGLLWLLYNNNDTKTEGRINNFMEGVVINLGCDVDFNGRYVPEYHSNNSFNGKFYGHGHAIGNYKSKFTGGGRGFFMSLGGNAHIEGVSFINATVNQTGDGKTGIGTVAGLVTPGAGNTVTIKNVYSNVKFTGKPMKALGGIIGRTTGGSLVIENCEYSGAMEAGGQMSGGIAGYLDGELETVKISNCRVSGEHLTSIDRSCGGVVGYIHGENAVLTMTNCYVKSTLNFNAGDSKNNSLGGLIGRLDAKTATISDCEFTGTLNANFDPKSKSGDSNICAAGGLIGYAFNADNPGEENDTIQTMGLTISNCKVDAVLKFTDENRDTTDPVTAEKYRGVYIGYAEKDTTVVTLKNVSTGENFAVAEGADLANMNGTSATVVGYQTTDVVDGKYDLRYVATVDAPVEGTGLGFEVSIYTKKGEEKVAKMEKTVVYAKTIYEKINGGNETYKASDFYADYLYTLVITGIDDDYTIANGNLEIVITPFVATQAEVDGATAVTITNAYTAQHGEIVINVAD